MDRRTFLGTLGAGSASLTVGGGVAAAGRWEERWRRETGASAAPVFAARRLGASQVVWSGPAGTRAVALTFDDGPDPELTPRVLDVLAGNDVRATFAVMGWSAARHPELVRRIVGEGHEVANHTWSHEDPAVLTPGRTTEQIERGREAIAAVTDAEVRFFRPPRGSLTGAALRAAATTGHDVLMWSLARGVAGTGTVAAVEHHLTAHAGGGDIVLLHDGIGRGTFHRGGRQAHQLLARRRVELDALPAVVHTLLDRGLHLVTASALVGPRNDS